MAYSLGQHTYEEKGGERSWVTDTFSRVDVYTKSVGGHQEKLRTDARARVSGRQIPPWHIQEQGAQGGGQAIPVIPVLEAPRQRREWRLVG